MNCSNVHSTPRAADCPFCALREGYEALRKVAPDDPALSCMAFVIDIAETERRIQKVQSR